MRFLLSKAFLLPAAGEIVILLPCAAIDRKTLEDAQVRPENHRSLYVRVTGFSEYFTSLSPEQQQEIIKRTEYDVTANGQRQ
ncbi:MAG: hypothetical protein IJW17_12800 [Lentisphaeria bacterium]|jgi:pyruvate-formate lyase|nr:hypothetical protein [Lentisphaeria bacterium]